MLACLLLRSATTPTRNTSHGRYYYAQCFNNGKGPGWSLTCKGEECRGRNPTVIENVDLNATGSNAPGTFYYDRQAATISYVTRCVGSRAAISCVPR